MTDQTTRPELRSRRSFPRQEAVPFLVVVAVVAVGVVLRFVTTSPMWLDEALTVNIARLPVDELLEALRQDGHPPLYYLLLHWWMDVFGEGDVAVRALSGAFSVATLPLVWIAARRQHGIGAAVPALVLMTVTPFNLRYATEARMYSLLALLAIAGWLLAEDVYERGGRGRWLGLAVVTGASLLTHYWAIYMGIAAVFLLVVRWWRRRETAPLVRTASALLAGCLFFVPWLPSFVYQATHTGTPWARAARPTQALQELIHGLGGGYFAEAVLFGFGLSVLVVISLFAVRSDDRQMVLDVRTDPEVRPEVAFVAATLAVGLAVGLLTQGAFIARYAAGVVPLVLVTAGVGLARIPGVWSRRLVLSALVVLATIGGYKNIRDPRTQGEQLARAVVAEGTTDDLVVVCPDQLGPSTLRTLPDAIEAVGVPTLERPDRIDWVDYEERNRGADPAAVTRAVLEKADGETIWLVYNGAYRTYENLCPELINGLGAARGAGSIVVNEDPTAFERATLYRFDP